MITGVLSDDITYLVYLLMTCDKPKPEKEEPVIIFKPIEVNTDFVDLDNWFNNLEDIE